MGFVILHTLHTIPYKTNNINVPEETYKYSWDVFRFSLNKIELTEKRFKSFDNKDLKRFSYFWETVRKWKVSTHFSSSYADKKFLMVTIPASWKDRFFIYQFFVPLF